MAEEIRKTIDIDAPPSVVFKALSDEKQLVHWMPKEAKMDVRVGGEYEFRYYWPARNLGATARGKILELIPDKRLSYTFISTRSDSGPSLTDSVVTWVLEKLPDGKTRVTLVHSGIVEKISGDTDDGWSYYMGQLASYSKSQADQVAL